MSEWINSGNRHPKDAAWYLVYDHGDIFMAYWYPTWEKWEDSSDTEIHPKYWMPLPEPPK